MRLALSRNLFTSKWMKFHIAFLTMLLIFPLTQLMAVEKYSNPKEVNDQIHQIKKSAPKLINIKELTQSPGGTPLLLLEIGTEIKSNIRSKPAIMIVGNMEGKHLHATEAALFLAKKLANKQELLEGFNWYILPQGNPDAAERFFKNPLFADSRNTIPHNDDMDDQIDEDGFNDLDGNGFITKMRVASPDGQWIILDSDSRLMKKADPIKGEKGMYKIYSEGLDDDGDGKYNEDGLGGTNVGINFPHLFKYFGEESGLYPGSTPEVYALMEFIYAHPEISMSFSFGATNFCLVPPKGGRKGSVDMNKIKIPENRAKMLDMDASITYTMKEVMEAVQPLLPSGMVVTEGMIASFFGLGAEVNPKEGDLKFYNKLNKDYKEYLKAKGIEEERLDPEAAKDGSFELWSYYHLGVPVFSMDLWGVPKVKKEKKEGSGLTLESVEKMSSEDFLAIEVEKVVAFLRESGMPKEQKTERIIGAIKGGKLTPGQLVGMLKNMPKPKDDNSSGDPKEKALLAYADTKTDAPLFVDWAVFDHPQLGKVEIGGFVPYADILPPVEILDSIFEVKVPWIFNLTKQLPNLKISETKLTSKGQGVYQLDVWVENPSLISFPTEMGKRNKQPAPAILIIEGDGIKLIDGYKRTRVKEVGGMKSKKFSWIIQTDKAVSIQIKLESKSAGNDVKQIKIGA